MTAEEATALGQVIRERRKGLGISMAAAAEAAGISRFTWHRIENGEATVAIRSWLDAAAVLGMDVRIAVPAMAPAAPPDIAEWLPLRIDLAEFPQLQRLAWQVREGVDELTPREAFGIYERNWRHVDQAALQPREQALVEALRRVFAQADV